MTPQVIARQVVAQAASSAGSSTPRQLAFVPERHVDFVFSVYPEPVSIVALVAVVLLLLALAILLRRRRAKRDGDSPDE
jgi:cell division protein FtsW (lipid II flippase)